MFNKIILLLYGKESKDRNKVPKLRKLAGFGGSSGGSFGGSSEA